MYSLILVMHEGSRETPAEQWKEAVNIHMDMHQT